MARRVESLDPRDQAALGVIRIAVGAQTAEFRALVQRLEVLRQPRRGQPLIWARYLQHWPTDALAGAVLLDLIRHTVWSENKERPRDLPRLSTVASSIGTNLLGYDVPPDLPLKVGVGLLDVVREVGLIEDDVRWRGSIRVRATGELFGFAERIVNEKGSFDLRQRPTEPPLSASVRTKPEVSMLIKRPHLPPRVLEAVNRLQRTGWRINKPVLDRMVGRIGTDAETLSDADKWTLGEAGMLAPFERFYIPMHLDYRGRVHQGGGLLTYTGGTDLARGLLEFADGVQLDSNEGNSLDWLAWHAAQMWGDVKNDPAPALPLGYGWGWEREARERAERWREAERPVQFLAAALALVDAKAGRPVHVPVRVDATCSGLQHLALLARDVELAKRVNLWENIPGAGRIDRGVAAMFIGSSQEPDFYAAVAEATGFTRKETKRMIVPLLYGAGDATLGKKLAEVRRGEGAQVTAADKRDAKAIESAAKALAPRAFDVLRWFKQVAVAHSSPEPVPICWTTPSGFKVVQDYRHFDRRIVKVPFLGRMVGLRMRSPARDIKIWKQQIALPSSIVHSLDAAFLTELVARAPIEQWATAHDAFAVPANRMWELLREPLTDTLRLYETDWLGLWTQAWRADGIAVPDPPEHPSRLPREMLHGLGTLG